MTSIYGMPGNIGAVPAKLANRYPQREGVTYLR